MSDLSPKPKPPRVSVVMAVYNGQAYIGRAIESVLAQTERSLELIIVDDGSRDGTVEIVEEFAQTDPRVRLITGQARQGPGHARNTGIDNASGEWIALIDSDDWYTSDRLQVLINTAEAEGADLVADNQLFVFSEEAKPHRLLLKDQRNKLFRVNQVGLLENDVIGRVGNYGLLKPLIRRELITANQIRYIDSLRFGEDFLFLLDCMDVSGSILILNEPHYYYRVHGDSISISPEIGQLRLLLETQNRYLDALGPGTDPEFLRLMRLRARQTHNYIRYRCVAEPLKKGDVMAAFRQVVADPGTTIFAVKGGFRLARRMLLSLWSKLTTRPSGGPDRNPGNSRARKAIGAARFSK